MNVKQPQNDSENALESLGIKSHEVEAYIESEAKAPYAKQICICGHPMIHHRELAAGRLACVNGQMYCPCIKPEAVLVAQDTRYFSRKTEGWGVRHALVRGLHETEKNGKWAKFLIAPSCKMCRTCEPPLLPTSVSKAQRPSRNPEPENVFLCEECIRILLTR